MQTFTFSHADSTIDPLLMAYLRQQGRALRIFNEALEVLWDNQEDRTGQFAIFGKSPGPRSTEPAKETEHREWPVARALANGEPAERMYWDGKGPTDQSDCFLMRAWVLTEDPSRGRLVIEEIQICDKRHCAEARLNQLDQELSSLIGHVTNLIVSKAPPHSLRLRLPNVNLQACTEINVCERLGCPAYDNTETLRCWEIEHTHCREGMERLDPLEKFIYCEQCEVFLAACPDPLTRVGENLNRLLALLQMKHREAMEAQQRVQQTEKLATIGEIMAGLAHEIKTPLSVIIGRLECLTLELDSLDRKELGQDLRVMLDHTGRMRGIIEEVLSMARPRPPQLRPIQMNEEVRHVLEMLSMTLQREKIHTRTELDEDLPLVNADRLQMQQALINLLLNARDASPEGGSVRLRTWVRHSSTPAIAISIADEGHGIQPDHLGRIFSPFYSTKLDQGGTGLGLTVCQRIMIDHGGRIEVASQPGKGSTFTLWLPVARTEA